MGTAIAPNIGPLFILSDVIKNKDEIAILDTSAKEIYLSSEAAAVQKPFLGLAIFITFTALIFLFSKLPKMISKELTGIYIEAFKNKKLKQGC